ncbi:MAG: AMP-binding protein, partial [Janthinobacterium lividum]
IWDSPVTGTVARLSFATLRERTARLAGGLQALGVGPGDRVLISMPPVPEAVIAMLACARLGAVHVVVFTGFSPGELAARIDDTTPVAVVSASCFHVGSRPLAHVPVMQDALAAAAHRPSAWVLLDRTPDGGRLPPWSQGVQATDYRIAEAAEPVDPVVLPATAPLYILHSSGTTGHPKGIVRDCGGYAVAMQRSMRLVYGLPEGGVFCTTADLGWVVGHSYGVYGPLIAGCTTVLYEGGITGTPDAAVLWRLCAAHQVDVLFTSPSALRAVRAVDPGAAGAAAHDLRALQAVFLAGERADPALLDWARTAMGVPVHDHWWQTETGWCVAGPRVSDQPPMTAMPGFVLRCLDPDGREQEPGASGELVLRLPLPPGCLAGLWRDPERMDALYLRDRPGYFRTFDYGRIDAEGGVAVLSRIDDVIKVAGRLVATGPIEDVLMAHPDVTDCVVIGCDDELRGQRPVAYVVAKSNMDASWQKQLQYDLIASVRGAIGGFLGLRRIILCEALPRTRSGKILRRRLAHDVAPIRDNAVVRQEAALNDVSSNKFGS